MRIQFTYGDGYSKIGLLEQSEHNKFQLLKLKIEQEKGKIRTENLFQKSRWIDLWTNNIFMSYNFSLPFWESWQGIDLAISENSGYLTLS